MPTEGGGGGYGPSRNVRRPKRVSGGGGYTLPRGSGTERATSRPRPVLGPPAPKRVGVFAQPIGRNQTPGAGARRRAAQNVRRAERKLPQRPAPSFPLFDYTPKQAEAVLKGLQRALQGAKPSEIREHSSARPFGRARGVQQGAINRAAARALIEAQKDAPSRTGWDVVGGPVRLAQMLGELTGAVKPGKQPTLEQVGSQLRRAQRHSAQRPLMKQMKGRTPAPLAALLSPKTNFLLAAAQGVGKPVADSPWTQGALRNLGDLARFPIIAGYHIGDQALTSLNAAVPWATDEDRAERARKDKAFWGGMREGIDKSAIGELLLHQDPVAAGKAFKRDPIFSIMDFLGAGALAGRGAGAVARGVGSTPGAGGLRGGLARAGTTVRPSLGLDEFGSGTVMEREFSKDLFRKFFQVRADKRRRTLTNDVGRPLTHTTRGQRLPLLAARDSRPGSRVRHPVQGSERAALLARRGTFVGSRANSAERLARLEATDQVLGGRMAEVRRVTGLRERASRDIISMVTEGTLRTAGTLVPDLRSHRAKLDDAVREAGLDPAKLSIVRGKLRGAEGMKANEVFSHVEELAANRRRAAVIDKVLAKPDRLAKNAEAIFDAGTIAGRHLNAGDQTSMALRILDEEAGTRSPRMVWAQEHMGARHFDEAEHRVLEGRARQAENAALEAYRAERTPANQKAWRAARARRIAVSGRDRKGVLAHEGAQSRVRTTEARVKAAEKKLDQARRESARLRGAHSVQSGQKAAARMRAGASQPNRARSVLAFIDDAIQNAEALKAGARIEGKQAKSRAQIAADIAAAEKILDDSKAALAEARESLKAAPLPEVQAALRKPDGTFLSNDEIIANMRAAGRDPDTVAYLPHRNDQRGARAFHARFDLARPNLNRETRTGSAYAKGATEASLALIRDQAARQATQTTKARQVDSFIREHGLRHNEEILKRLSPSERKRVQSGAYMTGKEAEQLIDKLKADTGHEYVALRAFPSKQMRGDAANEVQGAGQMEAFGERLLNDRLAVDFTNARARNVVLVPKALADRLAKNLQPPNEIVKFFQFINKPFRLTVLSQPRWLTGNFVEPYLIRLPTVGSGFVNVPGMAMDVRAALKVVRAAKKENPQQYAELRSHHLGGLFVGERGSGVRRTIDEIAGIGHYGGLIRRMPVVKQVAWFFPQAANTVFRFNRLIEQGAQYAAFGHKIRQEVQAFSGSWLEGVRMGEKAVEEVRQGLVNTPTQQRFAAFQDELLGQYTRFSPGVRTMVQTGLPFLPWFMNAARFVYWTLPAKNSVKAALIYKIGQSYDESWKEAHKKAGALPGGLELAGITDKGGFVDFARYTPFGFAGPIVEGDVGMLADPFLPQPQGALRALEGKDPFGRDLKVSEGDHKADFGDRLGIAVNSLAEAFIPYVSQVRRLRESGGTAYADSTIFSPKIKPGSETMSGPRRVYDPFRPTYLRGLGGGTPQRPEGISDRQWERLQSRLKRAQENEGASSPGARRQAERLERRRKQLEARAR